MDARNDMKKQWLYMMLILFTLSIIWLFSLYLIPATLLGLNIGPAVALHEGSTLLVVFNALCLLAFRDDP